MMNSKEYNISLVHQEKILPSCDCKVDITDGYGYIKIMEQEFHLYSQESLSAMSDFLDYCKNRVLSSDPRQDDSFINKVHELVNFFQSKNISWNHTFETQYLQDKILNGLYPRPAVNEPSKITVLGVIGARPYSMRSNNRYIAILKDPKKIMLTKNDLQDGYRFFPRLVYHGRKPIYGGLLSTNQKIKPEDIYIIDPVNGIVIDPSYAKNTLNTRDLMSEPLKQAI